MTRPPRGTSLYADAWRRLLRNRMAVLCGLIVLVMVGLVVCSPWLAPFSPEHQELWIGQQPPGFEHPDVNREMLLAIGVPAPLPARSARAAEATGIRIRAREATDTEVRVAVSRGRIRSLTTGGVTPVDEVAVGPATGSDAHLKVLDADQQVVRVVQEGRLVRGEAVPDWLADQADGRRRWVCLLRRVEAQPLDVEVRTANGVVTELRKNGEPRQELLLHARDVVEVLAGETPVTHRHWLGTDDRGRDLLSRILYGGWISLLIGVVATLVSLAIGVVYGAVSAYLGGAVDTVMMAIVDILYGIPYMFLVILLLVVFGRSIVMLFVALGCVQWLTMARIVRGQVLSLRGQEFVEAARVSGGTRTSIIWRHLIPNCLGVVVVYATLTVPAVILQEAFLAFIGLNVEYRGQAIESWGAMVNTGRLALGTDGQHWWLLVFPAVSLALLLFSLNFLGDGLRDAFDPRQKGRR
jgi:oligopeptide transport system permease protein